MTPANTKQTVELKGVINVSYVKCWTWRNWLLLYDI